MSDTVIKIDGLSKSYLIGHQRREKYLALRDVLAEKAKSVGKRLLHPLRGASVGLISGDEFEEFWALDDVSFEVKQGERVGIIGRNGAGKSTLLKMLSRITEPTRGRIEIDGRVASLLEVGTGFHPELTGRENVFLNGAILGMSRVEIKRKFDEIVDFAEVEKFLDTPVKRYSSGMYVRLAFAVAAHLEPEILVVDEVLAVGDAQFQKKCLGKMEEVSHQGRTILFVSHNMSYVSELCDRGILLNQGRLELDAPIDDAIDHYLNRLKAVNMPTYKATGDGSGSPYIESAWISYGDGEPLQEARTGDSVGFSFKVGNPRKGLSFNFSICDMMGHKVSNFNTLNTCERDLVIPGENFVCTIEELMLSEGTYLVNMALVEGGALIDHKTNAMVFDVCAASLRGRKIGNSNYGTSILMHHSWKLPS